MTGAPTPLVVASGPTEATQVVDWDDAYANAPHIPDAGAVIAGWERDAPRFRAEMIAAGSARLDLPYGDGARERWDLFLPEGAPRGLVVFIHGGYWMKFDKSVWSHLARGAVDRGWAMAMPGYPLAPKASLPQITRSIARFMASASQTVAGPIVLSGHSAGGHLASRMLCTDVDIAYGAADRIARCVSISGIHDLRPLMRTEMNDTLRIDAAAALAESPALLTPRRGAQLVAWVGGSERPEFIRQSALLANIWTGFGARTTSMVAPGRHHFDVIAGLGDPRSALTDALLGGL
jgi:arylformamidase